MMSPNLSAKTAVRPSRVELTMGTPSGHFSDRSCHLRTNLVGFHRFLFLQLSCVFCVSASCAFAQQQTTISWEGEIEIETTTVIDTDGPSRPPSETSANLELAATVPLSDAVELFASLQAEWIDDPEGVHSASEPHVFVDEVGVSFAFPNTSFSFGKVTPVFGSAFDSGYGFFSGDLAGDYELDAQIGGLAHVDLGRAGVVDFGVFYADDTRLNRSLTSSLHRNTDDAGGVGNTGKLNNATLQWSWSSDNTAISVGGRVLSRGQEGTRDELGAVLALAHFVEQAPLDLLAEFAVFDGWEGTSSNARFLTLNAGYAFGNLTLSGALARREIAGVEATNLGSLALEYEFENGVTLGGAVAQVERNGSVDQMLGLNLIYEFGN